MPSNMHLEKARVLQYKVVETSTVHDQALEGIINSWVSQGWQYDGMQFAMQPAQRRPTMAFILFTREIDAEEASAGPGGLSE
jgi:hypothetical protein